MASPCPWGDLTSFFPFRCTRLHTSMPTSYAGVCMHVYLVCAYPGRCTHTFGHLPECACARDTLAALHTNLMY